MHRSQSCGLEWLSIVSFKNISTLVLSYLMLEFAQRFKIFPMYILQTRCHEIINLMQLVDFYSSYIQMVWKGNYILNIKMYVQGGRMNILNQYKQFDVWTSIHLVKWFGIYYNIMCVLRKMKNKFWLKSFRYFVIFKISEC